jgi:hypothetical protein
MQSLNVETNFLGDLDLSAFAFGFELKGGESSVVVNLTGTLGFLFRQTYTMDNNDCDDDDDSLHNKVSVAFIGNSMLYFNDFPRFFEKITHHHVVQNSCLHGGGSIASLLLEGNAMYPQFQTPNALLGHDVHGNPIYDYGACTVPQLLLGWDDRLHDPGYAQTIDQMNNQSNPCRHDWPYFEYALETFGNKHHSPCTSAHQRHSHPATSSSSVLAETATKHWDFVVINDNTRNPAQAGTRARALATLEQFYVPWFLETGATPVFLWTHAYIPAVPDPDTGVGVCGSDIVTVTDANGTTTTTTTPVRDMTGLQDVANFTSLTRVGYQAYVDLLAPYLPAHQHPRIAPVGLAFLAVHEENYEIWQKLFHCDGLHASPSGTFLQGCIIHYTLFGTMPDHDFVVRRDMSMLWKQARMMQHYWEPPNPFPDRETAEYLYKVAERVMKGYVPKSFINYQNGEVAATGAPSK